MEPARLMGSVVLISTNTCRSTLYAGIESRQKGAIRHFLYIVKLS